MIPGVVGGDAVMDGDVLISGPWGRTQLNGELDIAEGHIQIEGLGQYLHDITGRLELRGDRAIFPESQPLRAEDSGGSAVISGDVAFEGMVPRALDLRVTADDFPVRREGMVLAWLSGRAAVDGRILDERTRSRIQTRRFA